MGSDLTRLRNLLETQLNVGTTSTSSDPSSTTLNTYINKSIRKIVRESEPVELLSATPTDINIVANANTVTVPSTLLTTHNVYYKDNSGTFKRLTAMPYKQLVAETGANNFFNTSYTGDPIYYTSRGTSLVFNRYFNRTETAAIKVDGVTAPTTLSSDSDTTELPVDYDMLITYFSAFFYYQRDDDFQNQQKFQLLAQEEKTQLSVDLDKNNESVIMLDPSYFTQLRRKNDPSVFFSG